MLLLNYSIPENIHLPYNIYEYTDNERYLLLLFGNSILQTIKTNVSLTNEDKENPIIKELTNKYSAILKEKNDIITELEISKKISSELYKELLDTERSKINNEIEKEILKERQYIAENTKILKEHYENNIISLKNEKEKIQNEYDIIKSIFKEQSEKIKVFEYEKIKSEEKIKYDEQIINSKIEQERSIIYNELYNNFQIEKTKFKEEIDNKSYNTEKILDSLKNEISTITNELKVQSTKYENTISSLKNENELEMLKIKKEFEIKELQQNEIIKNENILLKTEIQKLINDLVLK